MCRIVSVSACSIEWNRDRPSRCARISRAVSGLTIGLAAEAEQHSEEAMRAQESFIVVGGDGLGCVELRRR